MKKHALWKRILQYIGPDIPTWRDDKYDMTRYVMGIFDGDGVHDSQWNKVRTALRYLRKKGWHIKKIAMKSG